MQTNSTTQFECRSCTCRAGTQWDALSSAELQILNDAKECREYAPNEIVFNEGDVCKGVYCILSGLVVVRKSNNDGDYILLRRLGQPGTTLGYRPFLADDCHRGTAVVISPSLICHIDRHTLTALLHRNPNLGLGFLKQVAIDLGQAEREILEPLTDARIRLAHALLLFKERYGKQSPMGNLVIELPLHRNDLAAMAGIHPESVTKIFRSFKNEGIGELNNHTFTIKNMHLLFSELNEEYV